ncbi:MAG: PAS domain S-box protein [Salinivirgaceae bacterium]|nr:PAS domain S-box protein [Salinivirgaceae bacterium]
METIIYIGSIENRPSILDKSNSEHTVITIEKVDMEVIGQSSSALIFIDLKSINLADVLPVVTDKHFSDTAFVALVAPGNAKLIKSIYESGFYECISSADKAEENVRMENVISKVTSRNKRRGKFRKVMQCIDLSSNSFMILDAMGELIWCNDGFVKMYGYNLDNFKVKFGSNILEFSDNPNIKKYFDRCIGNKEPVTYSAAYSTGDTCKWIQTTLTPILGRDGNVKNIFAVETDITNLKEAEMALNQKNEYMLSLTKHLQETNKLLEQQQLEINSQNAVIAEEKRKSDELLLNILPFEIMRQLKSKGSVSPRQYKSTTILFLDFANFTSLTSESSPKELIERLDSYFKIFDDITDAHFIEKIKTIGDAYMCAGGLPLSNKSHPFDTVLAALDMQYAVNKMAEEQTANGIDPWRCRIGLHSGPAIVGVVGRKKYVYDVWGVTVNTAARVEQEGVVGKVCISENTYDFIKDFFECECRGTIYPKHMDPMKSYIVHRLKPEFSDDELGLKPNEVFKKMLNTL